jgi:hypothetical protein
MVELQEKATSTGSRNVLRQFVTKYEAASGRGDGCHLQDDFCGNVRDRSMQNHIISKAAP